ncbi:aspartyl/glutamyl-tRNA amidotransferase subunit A [Candidatus Saccharibacteria bacterium]|nr:aspartyl/glutamyl-tRNA amidotransferase subunit A [Candidatus Saccharibacteria bacterium]
MGDYDFGKGLKKISEELISGEVTSEELVEVSLRRAKEFEKYGAFVTLLDDESDKKGLTASAEETSSTPPEAGKSVLTGIPYAMKDNVSTTGVLTTGSCNILRDYVPIFDATCYRKLSEAGAVMVGKTVLDELAMGGSGLTGYTGPVVNPWDETRQTGGSSAGSAVAVALGVVPYAIGTDTGDSIRNPAGNLGVVGYKPTYGMISRWGVFAFASSMDTVGVLARSVRDAAIVADTMRGRDELDMTSYDSGELVDGLDGDVKGKKLFVVKELAEELKEHSLDIYENYLETIEVARKAGMEVLEESVDRELLKCVCGVYFAISCAEATSNNSNLTGVIFGVREDGATPDEVMINTRTKGFSEFVKKRFVLGSYILQAENQEKLFKNAQRVRRLVVDRFNELFEKYDGWLAPNAMGIAPKIDEEVDRLSNSYLILSQYLAIANFGGFPSVTIPSGVVRNNPVGVNITAKAKDDAGALNIAVVMEKVIGFKALDEKLEEMSR